MQRQSLLNFGCAIAGLQNAEAIYCFHFFSHDAAAALVLADAREMREVAHCCRHQMVEMHAPQRRERMTRHGDAFRCPAPASAGASSRTACHWENYFLL